MKVRGVFSMSIINRLKSLFTGQDMEERDVVKNDVDVLNLRFRVIPCALYRRGHVARGENSHAGAGNHGSDEQNKAQNQAGFFLIHFPRARFLLLRPGRN